MTGPTALTPAPTMTITAQAPISFGGLHSSPQFEVLELLPPNAAEKLRMLRQRSADMHTLCVPFEDIREATNAKLEAERQLKRLTDHPQDFGFNLPPTDARVVAAEKHLAKVTDDLRRLKERGEVRAQAWQAASAAKAACETWLRDGRPHGTVLEDYDGPEPKLLKGETSLLDAIENRR